MLIEKKTALTRWRSRCERFIASAKWLPWRRRYVPGLRVALDDTRNSTDAVVASVTLLTRNLFTHVGRDVDGVRCAVRWFGEEVSRR